MTFRYLTQIVAYFIIVSQKLAQLEVKGKKKKKGQKKAKYALRLVYFFWQISWGRNASGMKHELTRNSIEASSSETFFLFLGTSATSSSIGVDYSK